MAAATESLAAPRTRPAAWDALMPSEDGVKWQVWAREKGPGYWLMRYATKLARLACRIERALGRDAPETVTNPNALEDFGTWHTEEEAKDLCRIVHERTGGRYAVTYTPVVIGRAYPLRRVRAAGDRYFDPFKVFDFSATEAVREQARYVLIDTARWEQLTDRLRRMAERA